MVASQDGRTSESGSLDALFAELTIALDDVIERYTQDLDFALQFERLAVEIQSWRVEVRGLVGDSGLNALPDPQLRLLIGSSLAEALECAKEIQRCDSVRDRAHWTHHVPPLLSRIEDAIGRLDELLDVVDIVPDDIRDDVHPASIVYTSQPSIDSRLTAWLDKVQLPAASDNSSSRERFWVPSSAYATLLDSGLFDALLADVLPGDRVLQMRDTIAETALRVFCILSSMGKAHLIDEFVEHDLRDDQLPFSSAVVSPVSTIAVQAEFCEAQWSWCTPTFTRAEMAHIDDKAILPFLEMQQLWHGNTSDVYKVVLSDEQAFKLGLNGTPTCVLKSYHGLESFQEYRNEITALESLRLSESLSASGFVKLHGSFKWSGTYNLVMEWAAGGTLQDLFREEPPSSPQEMTALWRHMLDVIEAIHVLHSLDPGPEDVLHNTPFVGTHLDVKPSNILVVHDEVNSDYVFKLADMGLARLRTESDVTGQGRLYTDRTYVAPECYGRDSVIQLPNEVKQSVDIWSLGCIMSEALVWSVEGSAGLEDYRARRQRELANGNIVDAFHDGRKPLSAIQEKYRAIAPKLSPVARQLSEQVISRMLVADPHARLTAAAVWNAADEILITQDDTPSLTSSRGSAMNSSIGTPSIYSPDLRQVRRLGGNTGSTSRSSSADQAQTRVSEQELHAAHAKDLAGRLQITMRQQELRQMQGKPSREDYRSVPANEDMPGPPRASVPLPPRRVMTLDEDDTDDDQQIPESVGRTFQGARTLGNQLGTRPDHQVPSLWSPARATAAAPFNNPRAITGLTAQIPSPNATSMPRPTLSISQAQAWHRGMKAGNRATKLPHHEFLSYLENRDHVFLIDDAENMRPYWPDISVLGQLLLYITKQLDPDGIELYFSSTPNKTTATSSSALSSAIARHRTRGQGHLLGSLNAILSSKAAALSSGKAGRFFLRVRDSRPTSIYIFTDGNIGSTKTLEAQLSRLDIRRRELNLPRGQFSVQFITFGRDTAGLERLNTLDTITRLDNELDIVDTEPSNGNVWKMLLGAINDVFDDKEDNSVAEASQPTSAITSVSENNPQQLEEI